MAFDRVRRTYIHSAVILFNTVLLLLLGNAVCSVTIWIKHRADDSDLSRPRNPVGKARLLQAYPGQPEAAVFAMLDETWSRTWQYETLTQFKEAPFRGRYVNVDPAGFRMSTPQGPWPPDPANFNIFVLGGSTTFGYGVSDDETVPSAIQRLLARASTKPVSVYNFGRGNYFSTQELMLYYSLLTSGSVPQMAIFIDGYNELGSRSGELALTANLELLVEEHGWDENQGTLREFVNGTSAARVARWLRPVNLRRRAKPSAPNPSDEPVPTRMRDQWLTNKSLIEKLSSMFKVRPVFVWQPVPAYHYDYERYDLFRDLLDRDAQREETSWYRVMAESKPELQRAGNFLWLADMQENKRENLYVDEIHYTPAFNKEIAARISGFLQESGLLAEATPLMARGEGGSRAH